MLNSEASIALSRTFGTPMFIAVDDALGFAFVLLDGAAAAGLWLVAGCFIVAGEARSRPPSLPPTTWSRC